MTKLKFKRLMRKKWLYPALYLSVAALVLVGVFWYQGSNDGQDQVAETPQSDVQDEFLTKDGEEAVPVMDSKENLKMPVADEQAASIVTKFYDYNSSEEEQESALVLYNNKYYQSEGVDITREDGETFEVTASLSGTVTEVKEDPLYGNVVEISHEDEVATVYASLEDVEVKAGSDVAQGDVIGSAGRNSFGQASGVHVHFEVRNEGQPINPESFFGQPMTQIKEKAQEAEEAKEEAPAEEDAQGTEEAPADDPAEGAEEQTSDDASEEAPSQDQAETPEDGSQEDADVEEDPTQTEEGEQAPDEESASSISSTQA
ncbi:peptidoglycan DD-metalloendopeptidase family protein [Halobacillus sp. ACCC02827]|uniref:M23 family metallopeptidase n=1 Tax=Bacillaceae TaxID=186817 RepID=UPI001F3ADBF2|nr:MULTISPECIES: M23 family metallopeptidase [Bacillaceae]WJE15381.1 peptidoglycan DD-metalloendopeptidase family protein [Halobacillus sp. ACCC02827]